MRCIDSGPTFLLRSRAAFPTCLAVIAMAAAMPLPDVGVGVAAASSLQKEFSASWEGRMQQYRLQETSADAAEKSAIEAYVQAINTKGAEEQAGRAASVMLAASSQMGFVKGRIIALTGFRGFFASKPSQVRTEVFMQERASDLQDLVKKAQTDYDVAKAANPEPAPAYLSNLLAAIRLNGLARGVTQELSLIDQNLGSYYKAKSVADDERRQARAHLLATLAGSLQPPPTTDSKFPASVRCQTYGTVTNCQEN
jgi:hypothetical protein